MLKSQPVSLRWNLEFISDLILKPQVSKTACKNAGATTKFELNHMIQPIHFMSQCVVRKLIRIQTSSHYSLWENHRSLKSIRVHFWLRNVFGICFWHFLFKKFQKSVFIMTLPSWCLVQTKIVKGQFRLWVN